MNELENYLKDHAVVYVTRDIERALALPPSTRGYYIITNKTKGSEKYQKDFPKNIVTIGTGEKILDTYELLDHEDTKKYLATLKNPNILVFKNTIQIEKIAEKNNWKLLNPSATLANTIEEKVEQIKWLGNLAEYLPPHSILKLKDVHFENDSFILQFNHAHSGEGTLFIQKKEELETIQKQFPEREVRKVEYVQGAVITSNNIVTPEHTLIGNINYQITGLSPFTDLVFATIGNDFGLSKKLLTPEQKERYEKIVRSVGERLRDSGWKGLFGTDAIISKKDKKIYLIEINARQSAGTTFESNLQDTERKKKDSTDITVFEAHLISLLNLSSNDYSLTTITTGAQVIQRITKKKKEIDSKTKEALAGLGLTVLLYENIAPNSELIRIQSQESIMENDAVLNEIGKKIASILEN